MEIGVKFIVEARFFGWWNISSFVVAFWFAVSFLGDFARGGLRFMVFFCKAGF